LNPKFFRNGIVMLALVVVALAVVYTLVSTTTPPSDQPYSQFLNDVKQGAVTKITQEGSKLTVEKAGSSLTPTRRSRLQPRTAARPFQPLSPSCRRTRRGSASS